jgi:hypothetical protein
MKKLRRVTEAEVISEFLKNEFYQEEFQHDREQFERLVLDPDLTNEKENAIRRALLFRRRGHMWRELPPDTQWWQVQLELEDLARVRVFPRAHWRRIANGSFQLSDIVSRIRSERFSGKTRLFISKIQALSYRLRVHQDQSSIMLIGVDEDSPVTILEGNHRLTAALLASPSVLRTRFSVLCGFSPHMRESCWYETNIPNLWRYAKNRMKNLQDREADLNRLVRGYAAQDKYVGGVAAARKAITESK